MRELQKPSGISGDKKATELIRFWLAHDEPHLTLLLGMWEDADECEIGELPAWGNVLADIAQHIANGMEQSHGWSYEESMKKLILQFIESAKERAPGLEGFYPDEKS